MLFRFLTLVTFTVINVYAQDTLTPQRCTSNYDGTNPAGGELEGYTPCYFEEDTAAGLTIYGSNIPNHFIMKDNPNDLCAYPFKVTLPVPKKGSQNIAVPQLGPIAIAKNGVMIFGPGEGDGGNAVSGVGPRGIMVLCTGHPQMTGIWHYHHPEVGCEVVDSDTLVGWALDGFPIYGPLSGTKEEVDAQLDECNGRDFPSDAKYGYRYHVRSRSQVDETLTTNAGPDNTDNWKYFLGCYKGESYVSSFQTSATICATSFPTNSPSPSPAPSAGTCGSYFSSGQLLNCATQSALVHSKGSYKLSAKTSRGKLRVNFTPKSSSMYVKKVQAIFRCGSDETSTSTTVSSGKRHSAQLARINSGKNGFLAMSIPVDDIQCSQSCCNDSMNVTARVRLCAGMGSCSWKSWETFETFGIGAGCNKPCRGTTDGVPTYDPCPKCVL